MVIITPKGAAKIKELWESTNHSLPKVWAKTRLTPSIISQYVDVPEREITKFEDNLPDFDSIPFRGNDWGDLSILSEAEQIDLMMLKEELDI